MKRLSRHDARRRGFSLVEVLVAGTEAVALMALVLGIYVAVLNTGTSVGNYADMNTQAKLAMSRLESDLRPVDAVLGQADAGNLCSPTRLTVVVTTSAKFHAETGQYAITSEVVEYSYDATAKRLWVENKTTGAPKRLVLGDLADCQFAYFDGNDTPVLAPGAVKKIVLTARMSRGSLGKRTTDNLVSAVVVLRAR